MNLKVAFALSCLTLSLFADEKADKIAWIRENVVANAANKKKVEHPVQEKVITCSYDCDLFSKDKKVLFVNLEFLWWTVNEGALDYAIKMKNPAWGTPTDAVGHYKRAEFDWAPGARFNFGYFNAPHFWDAQVQYTYFFSAGSETAKAPHTPSLFLNGTWPQPDPTGATPLARAKSNVSLMMNLIELIMTRRFHPNPHLRIRVHGGPTVAWLSQKWEVNYHDIAGNKSHLKNDWHFVGAGMELGGIFDWFMGKGGYYLTAGGSLSFLGGDYHNVSKQSSSFAGTGFNPALPLRNAHYQDTRLVPRFQIYGGPSWQQSYKKFRTEIFIGYEFNIWGNLHEVIRTSFDTSSSPTSPKLTSLDSGWVGLQGVTFRWNIDF
jgi:hypothetical protein